MGGVTISDFHLANLSIRFHYSEGIRNRVRNNGGHETYERETEEPDYDGVFGWFGDGFGEVVIL